MILRGRAAEGYFARPDPDRAGLLIHGDDPARVAMRRQQVLAALLGPGAEEEMRLTRIAGADLRSDPAALLDAVKAVGFFPGPRAVLVEEAGDGNAAAILAALQDWAPGDARIVVTARQLRKGSKLLGVFADSRNAVAVALYDDPPTRAEIERILSERGLRAVPADSMAALADLAQALGPGDFAQLVEKVALYKLGDDGPLTVEDIAVCAPLSVEASLEEVLNAVAEGRSEALGPLLRRLQAQGTNATALCIGATRHFRTLYAVASAPGSAAEGIGRLRPPVFGRRRDRILRQVQGWDLARLERALGMLTDTDLALRAAGRTAPDMALVERALIRLAMLARARAR